MRDGAEILLFAATWMDLENISIEMSSTQRGQNCMISFMWNLKMLTSEKQRTAVARRCGGKGRGTGRLVHSSRYP